MGYLFFIMRLSNGLEAPGSPITQTEWLSVAATDPELRVNGNDLVEWAVPDAVVPMSEAVSAWRSPSDSLCWGDGAISSKSPSDAWRRKMLGLAKQLGARVVDEGGREHT